MYIHIPTLTQHSEQDIRAANPNTSFPVPFVAPEGYAYVFPAPATYDPVTQTATETTPEQTVLGHWEQRWTVTDKSAEQVAAESETARIASIPKQVTMRQARLALLAAGHLANVNNAINSMSEPSKSAALIEWEYAAVVERNSGLVPAMGAALGMTEIQLDDLFILAATL